MARRQARLRVALENGELRHLAITARALKSGADNGIPSPGNRYEFAPRQLGRGVDLAMPFFGGMSDGRLGRTLELLLSELKHRTDHQLPPGSLQILENATQFTAAFASSTSPSALEAVASRLLTLEKAPEGEAFSQGFSRVTGLLEDISSGDPSIVAATLDSGLMEWLSSGALSQSFTQLGQLAAREVNGSELNSALEISEAGFQFFSALSSGDLVRILERAETLEAPVARAAQVLRPMLEPALPMVEMLAQGMDEKAINALRHQGDQESAELFELLEPIGDLVRGDTATVVTNLRQTLLKAARLKEFTNSIRSMENAASQFLRERALSSQELARAILGYSAPATADSSSRA